VPAYIIQIHFVLYFMSLILCILLAEHLPVDGHRVCGDGSLILAGLTKRSMAGFIFR
jgi:hypothetical protein